MEKHLPFIQHVNQLAYQSAKDGNAPFAALLVKDNQNMASTIDKSISYSDPTAHAELILISEYCRANKLIDLKDYRLYCNVEPCVMCSGAIHWAKIATLVFSVSQQKLQLFSKGKLKPSCDSLINTGRKKIEIIGPLLEEEGILVFQDFPFLSKKERHQKIHRR